MSSDVDPIDAAIAKADTSTVEEGEVLHELKLVRENVTQGELEKSTIDEINRAGEAKKVYPLDGRNLERAAKQIGKKRKLKTTIRDKVVVEKVESSASIHLSTGVSGDGMTCVGNGGEWQCPTLLWDKLYEFQRIGVLFLLQKFQLKTGALLADEMGLGKSVQVIAFLVTLAVTRSHQSTITDPVLLVCPATLLSHWTDQVSKWASPWLHPVTIDQSSTRSSPASSTGGYPRMKVILISYEQFRLKLGTKAMPWSSRFSVVVLDEAQRIRNPDAKITQAVKRVNCYCRIALSGSPIQNNLSELWSIFDFVAPGRLGTLPTFQEELAIPIEEGTKPRAGYLQIQTSFKCAVVVRDLTAPLMLRRLKSDFAAELALADKDEQVLFCQLSAEQIEVYTKFLSTETVRSVLQTSGQNGGRGGTRMANGGSTFYCLSVLKKICNHPDLLLHSDLDVDDFGDEARSGKLSVLIPLLQLWERKRQHSLIFSQSLGMLDILERTLRKLRITYMRMDGSTSLADRAKISAAFDASSSSAGGAVVSCLLLSTRVGGVGLNLTKAERVVIFDPDWNPMTDAQARERSWRIGQTKEVKIYRLIAADTIEESICKRQIYKQHLAQKILVDPRGARASRVDWDGLHDLFKPPRRTGAVGSGGGSAATKVILNQLVKDAETVVSGGGDVKGEDGLGEDGGIGGISDLITKVWNQDEIETPRLCESLVDSVEAEEAAKRAVRLVLAESTSSVRDITVPTWTGKTSSTGMQRSQSLVAALGRPKSANVKVVESEHLVIEKSVVKELLRYFRKRPKSTAGTSEILAYFQQTIDGGKADIFRSSLRELCDFFPATSEWTLKPEHR